MSQAQTSLAAVRAIVVGASGYSGAEAAGLLLRHPGVEVVGLFGSLRRAGSADEAPARFDELHPRFGGATELRVGPYDVGSALALRPQVAFLATPHEVSEQIAGELLRAGVVVIDISAAFRFRDAGQYARAYGHEHGAPELLERAVYGIPEINRGAIKSAGLIACAGCYPTSAILALRPLAKAGAIDWARRPIVDSTSGVSGAGRGLSQTVHFCEVSLQPYKVLGHRHQPEISEQVGGPVYFTPHLGAFERGILSTMHVELLGSWDGASARKLLEETYGGEAFVRVLPEGKWPSVAAVRNTNRCDIGLAADDEEGHLIVVSAIDNLVKGAAGQAVQCMNVRFGFPEGASLS
ncbi:MAG: N-acetyl-gamma-glutamyl-phosphate reductase [Phycisphaerales bacterium]